MTSVLAGISSTIHFLRSEMIGKKSFNIIKLSIIIMINIDEIVTLTNAGQHLYYPPLPSLRPSYHDTLLQPSPPSNLHGLDLPCPHVNVVTRTIR